MSLLSPGVLQTIAFSLGHSLEFLGLHGDKLNDDIFELMLTNLPNLVHLDCSGTGVTGTCFVPRFDGPRLPDLRLVEHSVPSYLEQQLRNSVWSNFKHCQLSRRK